MKRIGKRVISWLCVLIMTISMAVPVSAVTYDGGTNESGANYPIVEAISYRNTSEGYMPTVSAGSAPVEFTLSLKNNNQNSTTKKINYIEFTYSDGKGKTIGFKTDKGCDGFSDATRAYYPSLVMTDTSVPEEGVEYTLQKFVVVFDNNISATYTANEFKNGNKIKIKYVSSTTNIFGAISVAFGEKNNSQNKMITLSESNPNETVKVYICAEKNSEQIKSVRLFYGYNGKTMEGPQGRVTVCDNNTVYYNANFNSDYKTGNYTIAQINIETTDNKSYSYYNNQDNEREFSLLNSLDFKNEVPEGMVTLDYFAYINDVLKTKTSTQTANVTNGEATVPIRVSARTVGKGTTLDKVIIKFVKRENSNITFQKEIPATDFSISNSKYYQTNIKIGADVAPGIYNVSSVKLVGKTTTDATHTTSYTKNESEGFELTPIMGCNTKLIVKNTDAIVPEETGAASKKSSVTKASDGKSSAQVSVDNSKVALDGELDSLGRKFANEKYDFTVESSAIPDNTNLEIGKVLTGNTYDIAKEVVKNDSSIASDFRVFEINLLGTGDKKVQPNGDVSISTDIPSGFKNMVVYRIEDGTTNKVKVPAHIENGKLVFDTNHFSTYILAQSTTGSGATESGDSSGGAGNSGDDSDDTGVTDNDGDEQNSSDSSSNTSSANNSSTGAVAVENKISKDSSGDSVASIKLSSGDKLAGVAANKLDAQAKAVLNQSFTFDVKAGNGVIPSGASMKISKVVTGTQYSDAKAVTNAVADKIAVFEIDLLSSSNAKIQPNGKLSITTDIPSGFDASRVAVYRLSTDGKSYTKLSSSVSGGKVSFETDHFSTYMIVQESAEAVAVKAPVTGDNAPVALLVFVLLSAMVTLGVSIKRNFYK